MAQPLEIIFGELGIAQYLDAFLEQGFDTWETILDITESDLDALGVKLGHRRKLQRRIANFRGIAPDASLVSPTQSAAEEPKLPDAIKTEFSTLDSRETASTLVTKRKYRRHPKPDENAPERPPSAYVLFSNKMREELKGRNLSFTEIAKLVGENWQNLTAVEKEPFESQAQAIKDKYLSDLFEYKKTPQYKKYMAYLQDFKAKHASPSQDKDASKRLKLAESGGQGRGSPGATPTRSSRSGSGAESRKGSEPPAGRQRVGSIVSASDSQYATSLAPSGPFASPEEPVLSPVVSDGERHSDRSPSFNQDPRDHSSLPGPCHPGQGEDQSREQLSMHRQLPSLSDMFDGQELQGGMRPSIETNGYRFPSVHGAGNPDPCLSRSNGDGRLAHLPHGQSYGGNGTNGGNDGNCGDSSSNPSFGQPRQSVDGSLPIHALLASKPERTFHLNQPPHLHHGNPYHTDQTARHTHQMPNGVAGLPVINGYRHHSTPSLPKPLPHINGHHINQGFPAQSQPNSLSGLPQQGMRNNNFDGMSALLKAGEIVDRRAQ